MFGFFCSVLFKELSVFLNCSYEYFDWAFPEGTCYCELDPVLQSYAFEIGGVELSALVLRPDDFARLAGLVEQPMEFHDAIIYLQSADIDVINVRAIFDGLLGNCAHSDAIKPYLSDVTKLQSEPRGNLTVSEQKCWLSWPPNVPSTNARARAPVDEATLTVVEKSVRDL